MGGARRASFELGRYLARSHHVDLYRLSAYSSDSMDLAPFVEHAFVYRFAPMLGLAQDRIEAGKMAPRSYTSFQPLKRLHRRIADDIRARAYDVVLAHTDGMTQSPYLLRFLDGVPSVYFCEEVLRVASERSLLDQHRAKLMETGPVLGPLRTLEDLWVMRRLSREDERNVADANVIVVNSRYSQGQVWAAYGRNSLVCSLGVDAGTFRPDPAACREFEVLSIGSPIATKGHAAVVESIAMLKPEDRPRLRVIAPRQAGMQALQELAVERGVDLVIEVDVDEETLVRRYQRATATVCAARLEPFGLTALESMACGTPVIAYREGGYQESIVDGKTGLLVAPNPAALARAIWRLHHDADLAMRLGKEARCHIEAAWTWQHSGARIEQILRSAVPG